MRVDQAPLIPAVNRAAPQAPLDAWAHAPGIAPVIPAPAAPSLGSTARGQGLAITRVIAISLGTGRRFLSIVTRYPVL